MKLCYRELFVLPNYSQRGKRPRDLKTQRWIPAILNFKVNYQRLYQANGGPTQPKGH